MTSTEPHSDITDEHVAKRARHYVHYQPLSLEQIAQLKRRLTALLFVPHGEIDDTRYEKLYSLLVAYVHSGDVVLKQFVEVGGIELICVRRAPSLASINVLQQAARHSHDELAAVAIRLVGAVGAAVREWPPCLLSTVAEMTRDSTALVLDAQLRAWTALAASTAITWSERARDLLTLAARAWQHESRFVSASAVTMVQQLIIHERIVPQMLEEEITCLIEEQCQRTDGDNRVVQATLELFLALVEHARGCELLARDQLLHRVLTRVIASPRLFHDNHVMSRVLELIDAVTRVNQHALLGNAADVPEEQLITWLEPYLEPLREWSRDVVGKELEFALRLLSHVNFSPSSRGEHWHVQQCHVYSHVLAAQSHHVTFLVLSNLLHHVRKDQLCVLHDSLWHGLHNYLHHVVEDQSRARLIEKNKRMTLQLFSLLAPLPNIEAASHVAAILTYLTRQSRADTSLSSVTLVCGAVQCLTLFIAHQRVDLTLFATKSFVDTCQLGLLHRTWEIRETFLQLLRTLMHSAPLVCEQLKHVIISKFSDTEPFVLAAVLHLFENLTPGQWSEWHSHVDSLAQCLTHDESTVRVAAWHVMTTWHQSGVTPLFMNEYGQAVLSRHLHAACQDEDCEVRHAAVEWWHVLLVHRADWSCVLALEGDVMLRQARADATRLVRLSAYRALHALFKQLHVTGEVSESGAALVQELRETDWARVLQDQEPSAVYAEDDEVFPLEPSAHESNAIDCPF